MKKYGQFVYPVLSLGLALCPWKADVTAWETMEPILREAPVIGEIGLDSEWCTVDMDIQRQVFRRQLALAAQLGKPVILHTKGMEREIVDTIRQFPNRYLVHWYACEKYLHVYIDLGCWFTVGPDVLSERSVETLAKTVPLHRLLIESDGVDGIGWGQNLTLKAREYLGAMERHLQTVATLRNLCATELLSQMEENLETFLYKERQ